jgi:hypothetical protein
MKRQRGVLLRMAEVVGPAEVRLFFSDGLVVERRLPGVKEVGRVRVIDGGLGLDPGDGRGDLSARTLYQPCKGRRVYSMVYDYGSALPRNPRAPRRG